MPYKISFIKKGCIVHVAFSGVIIKEDILPILNSAIQRCYEENTFKMLVDFSGLDSSNLSTIDVYSMGEIVSKTKHVRYIAHVLTNSSEIHEDIKFASNVEANRGKRTKNFYNLTEAITWLRNIP